MEKIQIRQMRERDQNQATVSRSGEKKEQAGSAQEIQRTSKDKGLSEAAGYEGPGKNLGPDENYERLSESSKWT